MSGPLALVGGGEWTEGCTFDRALVEASGATEVVVVPAGSAFENPGRLIERAETWFAGLGASVRALPVLTRGDGFVAENLEAVRRARFIYLPGSSPMHLRAVLKDSPMYDAIIEAWRGGATLVGSSAGADVLCDPMVDSRGGAFTVGLGLVPGMAVIPRSNTWSPEKVHRTMELAPAGVAVVSLPEATALIAQPGQAWTAAGVGQCAVYIDGSLSSLDALPRV